MPPDNIDPTEVKDEIVPPVEPTPPVEPSAEPPAPPAEPPVTPPAEPPPASPPSPAPAQPSINSLTEPQWVALEKQTGMNRNQILLSYSFAQILQDNAPANKLLEKEALNEAEAAIQDFAPYKEEVRKELEKLPVAERRNPEKIKETFWKVKGKALSTGTVPKPSAPVVTRRVVSGSISGGSEPPPATENVGLEKLSEFDKHVVSKYGIKSDKELKENNSKEINMEDEYNFKPDFSRK